MVADHVRDIDDALKEPPSGQVCSGNRSLEAHRLLVRLSSLSRPPGPRDNPEQLFDAPLPVLVELHVLEVGQALAATYAPIRQSIRAEQNRQKPFAFTRTPAKL